MTKNPLNYQQTLDALPNFIVKHFVNEMETKLVEEAIAAIRPAITAAAKQTVKELEPRIVSALDRSMTYDMDRLLVDIRLNGVSDG